MPSTTTTSTSTSRRGASSSAAPITSWAAFDRVFAEAFPPVHHNTRKDSSSTDEFEDANSSRSRGSPPPAFIPSSQLPPPAPGTARRERTFQQATETRRTTHKTVPSTTTIPIPTTPTPPPVPSSSNSKGKRKAVPEEPEEVLFNKVPAFQESVRRASRQTTQATPVTPSKPYHQRGESWSSSASGSAPSAGSGTPGLKKKKSRVTFKESEDGRMKIAVFELPGIAKDDINVSFQTDKIIVSWQTVKTSERQDGDRLIQERREKKSSRSLGLPEGANFDKVKATLEGHFLTVHYPNTPPPPRRTSSRGKDVHIH